VDKKNGYLFSEVILNFCFCLEGMIGSSVYLVILLVRSDKPFSEEEALN